MQIGKDALIEFLEVDKEDINRQQRIILIAEAYDYALLIGAEWLSEQYGVDIPVQFPRWRIRAA